MLLKSKKVISTLGILTVLTLTTGCATSWPNPYETPEPVIVAAPTAEPEVIPEPEPAVLETIPLPDSGVITTPLPEPEAPPPPPVIEPEPELAAVVALRGQAADSMAAGEPELAAATIERAIRIQPRNPVLWLDLAAIRFAQQEFAQSESTAKRALSYASGRNDISYDAWILIANSRYARNDREGGERAEAQASTFQ